MTRSGTGSPLAPSQSRRAARSATERVTWSVHSIETRLLFSADLPGLPGDALWLAEADSAYTNIQLVQDSDAASARHSGVVLVVGVASDARIERLSEQLEHNGQGNVNRLELEPDRGVWDQLDELIRGHPSIDALHVLQPLQGDWLLLENVLEHADQIAAWQDHFSSGSSWCLHGASEVDSEDAEIISEALLNLSGVEIQHHETFEHTQSRSMPLMRAAPQFSPPAYFMIDEGQLIVGQVVANDPDGDPLNFTLVGGADLARFSIDSLTGEIRFLSAPDYESPGDTVGNNLYEVEVQVEDSNGELALLSVQVAVQDVNEHAVSNLVDSDPAVNQILENISAVQGTGLVAHATDADGSATVSYTLTDDAGGLFTIDSFSGAVSTSARFNAENGISYTVEVEALSSDGSSARETFTITVHDQNEFLVSAIQDVDSALDRFAYTALAGDPVGLRVEAQDRDITHTVTYALSNDADGLLQVDPISGLVTLARDNDLLEGSLVSIDVQALSSDGSSSTASFELSVVGPDVWDVNAISDIDPNSNAVSELAPVGAQTGVQAFAEDGDAADTVSYSLIDDADGRFAIDSVNGVLTLAQTLDYETSPTHDVVVEALSTDGSRSQHTFTITVVDENEAFVSTPSDIDAAPNRTLDTAAAGSTVGLTLHAVDTDAVDTVVYALIDDANGRFTVDAISGVVYLIGAVDADLAASHTITAEAISSDGSMASASFVIEVVDGNQFMIGPISDVDPADQSVDELATPGSTVGITAQASDADPADSVSYSLIDDAGGRFLIDGSTGVLTLGAELDYETASSHSLTVQALSSDGSTSQRTFTIAVQDANEFSIGPISDLDGAVDAISESAAIGTPVPVQLQAVDADLTDTVSYSLSNNAGGLFAIDASSGQISLAGTLDYESATTYQIEAEALSSDGSLQRITLGISVLDHNEFAVSTPIDVDSNANSLSEAAAVGTEAGIVAEAFDADGSDTVSYALVDDAGGRFLIDANTGVLVLDAVLDHEAFAAHTVVVQALSSDGSTASQSFTIAVWDENEFSVSAIQDSDGAADVVAENSPLGSTVGIIAQAEDADGSDSVNYRLAEDAGGRFTIDASTGIVTTAQVLDHEQTQSHAIVVEALSSDGSISTRQFIVNVGDVSEASVSAVVDIDPASESVSETASTGSTAGITAQASDADSSDTVSYSLSDTAGGRFAIDSVSGVVYVVGALDYETATEHRVTVQAASSDGSVSSRTFTVSVTDVNDHEVSSISDSDPAANALPEDAPLGALVGLTAYAVDSDAQDSVRYELSDSSGGLFGIDPLSGVVTLQGQLDYERASVHELSVTALSSDGSQSVQSFTVSVQDVNDLAPVVTPDQSFVIPENSAIDTEVGTVSASDPDSTGEALNYSLSGGGGAGRFTIDANTGRLSVVGALDYEEQAFWQLLVSVSDGQFNSVQSVVQVEIADVNEVPLAIADRLQVDEDQSLLIDVQSSLTANDLDPEGGQLTFALISLPQQGELVLMSEGVYRYIPNAEFSGTDVFEYMITDDAGFSASAQVVIDVLSVNDAPILLAATGPTQLNENQDLNGFRPSVSDIDSSALSYSLSGGADAAQFTIDRSTGALSFVNTPDYEAPSDADQDNIYIVVLSVNDREGGEASAAYQFEVQNVNEAPKFVSTLIESETGSGVGQVLVEDPDQGDQLRFEIIGLIGNALFEVDEATGELSAREPLQSGTYAFDVRVSDASGLSATARLTVRLEDPEVPNMNESTLPEQGSSVTETGNRQDGTAIDVELVNNEIADTFQGTRGLLAGSAAAVDEAQESPGGLFTGVEAQTFETMVDKDSTSATNRLIASAAQDMRGQRMVLELLFEESDELLERIGGLFDLDINNRAFSSELSPYMLKALNTMHDEIDAQHLDYAARKELLFQVGTVAGVSLTVGFVSWLLNSGGLLAAAAATSPLWKSLDPVPVLAGNGGMENKS